MCPPGTVDARQSRHRLAARSRQRVGHDLGVAAADEQRRRGDTVERRRLRHLAVSRDDGRAREPRAPAPVVAEPQMLRQLLRDESRVACGLAARRCRDRLVDRCVATRPRARALRARARCAAAPTRRGRGGRAVRPAPAGARRARARAVRRSCGRRRRCARGAARRACRRGRRRACRGSTAAPSRRRRGRAGRARRHGTRRGAPPRAGGSGRPSS